MLHHPRSLTCAFHPCHRTTTLATSPLPPGHRVLHVGSGAGALTKLMASQGLQCVGIDADPGLCLRRGLMAVAFAGEALAEGSCGPAVQGEGSGADGKRCQVFASLCASQASLSWQWHTGAVISCVTAPLPAVGPTGGGLFDVAVVYLGPGSGGDESGAAVVKALVRDAGAVAEVASVLRPGGALCLEAGEGRRRSAAGGVAVPGNAMRRWRLSCVTILLMAS